MSVAGINVANIDTCTELLAGRSWLCALDALELARHKLLQAVTTVHIEDDSDHARLVFFFITCGTAGPLGSVPGMWNHLQGDQVN